MGKKIEDASREQIARFLPDAIVTALNSYQAFAEQANEDKAKEFKAKDFEEHHKACKVAIAHIELLLKLAHWAELPDARAKNHNDQIILAAMMQEAQEQLQAYHEGEDSE